MNDNFKTYKLLGDNTPASWQLPTKNVFTTRKGSKYAEQIVYIPGAGTIWKKDYKGNREAQNIWFDDGKIRAQKNNGELNEFLEHHPWYNKKFALEDPEAESKAKLDHLKTKRKAANLVEAADEDKLKAMALAVFGGIAMNWGKNQCELALMKEADNKPHQLVKKLEADDYQQKYAAALAINKRIVKYNVTKTAIVWADANEGLIIPLAKGENGITKLGEYLASGTEEADNTLQEIGKRVGL